MELTEALTFARDRHNGVLTTISRKGRPQLSNILYMFDERGTARISTTDAGTKVQNLRRDPRCGLYVVGDSHWAYVVMEGTAELSGVAADPNGAVVDELVAMYRQVQGEHPNWEEYRHAMVAEHRLVARLHPTRAYGMIGG